MKKVIILILFLFCLTINTYQAINKNNCTKEIYLKDLNSKKLFSYIKENHLDDHLSLICSHELCFTPSLSNIERSIKEFTEKNITYLKNKNEEQALEAELKGFKIEKIILYTCH